MNSMARTLRFVSLAGLALFISGLVVTGIRGGFNLLTILMCLLGLAGSLLFFLPRLSRNLSLYVNTVVYSALFLGCLVMVFLLVQRHPFSIDATADQIYSLSSASQSFLKRVSRPIRVTAFFTEAEQDNAARLLREYARFTPHFSYEIVNPFRDVSRVYRFGFKVTPGDIFVEAGTSETVTTDRFVKVNHMNEEELTNGIVQALRGQQVVIYFLTGHGELAIERPLATALNLAGKRQTVDDLVWLKEQLEHSHMKPLPLSLSQRGKVPADASLLVMAGPRVDIMSAEKEALRNYLDAGGRAIFLLNPDFPQMGGEVRMPLRNLADLLEEYGIVLPPDVVVWPQQQAQGGDIFSVPTQFREHRITQSDGDDPLFFHQTRPVLLSRTPIENAVLEPIIMSPNDSWRMPMEEVAKALLKKQKSVGISGDKLAKEMASYPLGVAVTIQPPGKPEENATRIVAIGNANFLSTEFISQRAWLMFQNAVNWLTNSGDLIAIRTKKVENTPITLGDGQKQFLFLLIVIIVPTAIGLGGVGYVLARRRAE